MSDFPKYQYSRFIDQDQIVVRTDNKEEFIEMVDLAKNFGKSPADPVKSVVPNVSVDEFEDNHVCPTHGTTMKERVSKTKGTTYYDHREQQDGVWKRCFGKGWLS